MAEPAVPDVKERFGQKEPPLTAHIVNILGRYPDGGQILKELIQNADDAEAREVKFLYDGRSFGKKYLATSHLQKYQGPALFAFNDAIFKPEDWEGIQNLMQSNKKSDILKVGRFGIGFNSVYHITDLPAIVSGKKIGFLDPHKRCFGNSYSGKQYVLRSNLLNGKTCDQFKPFQGVFDLHFDENYESTLFRFPLRTCPSKLSKTEYTKEKIDKLFDSLREEASIILLFMKNIQHISLYERIDDDDEVKCIFKVEIAPEMCEMVKNKRQIMLQSAVERDVTESSYVVHIDVYDYLSSDSDRKSFKWLVLNQIGLKEDERITELKNTLSLLPWVGCAVPLNENAQKEDSGRIFCFLPLPRDVDCQTGLPVLVHGAFGVTDNRRGLLWPGSECQNNETAEWNVLLVEKILSSVIYNALKSIITDCPNTGLNEMQRRELVYSTLPKLNDVVGHWKGLLDPLFQKLTQLNLFHAKSSTNTYWITLQQGLLDQIGKADVSPKTRKAVLEILLRNSQVIITDLPDHVIEAVEKYFGEKQYITSEFVRDFLRCNSIQTESHDDKLSLLDYVLYDNPQPQELKDIPLLPLASGDFVEFSQHCHNSDPSSSIFVSVGNCTKDLLPNMENRFLDKNIPTEIYDKLVAMATDLLDEIKPTQMVTLTPELVVACLRSSLPDEWFNTLKDIYPWNPDSPGHPPEKWIDDIWHWINDNNFESLEQFEGIPLIPLQSDMGKALGVLSKQSRFIFSSDSSQNMQLPSQVVGLLKAARCIVLPCISTFLHVRHPDISSYVASPVVTEVTLMLGKCSMDSAEKYIRRCSRDERKILQSFFSASQALSGEEKNILRHLPLLATLDGSYTAALVSEQYLSVASSKFKLPDGFNFRKANQIISSAELESLQLIRLLGLEPIEPADIFCRFLFPDIQSQSIYTPAETTRIMVWLLERICEIQNEEFLKEIKDLPFVCTKHGELKKPCELYDPNDLVLVDLFLGDDSKFPSEEFGKLISTLNDLGLRLQDKIMATDLLAVAERVALLDYQDALKKVQALVTIFEKFPGFLRDGRPLISKLAELNWIPRAKKYPRGTGYPNFLHNEWYSSEATFYKPDELFRESHTLLVGTSAPILGIKMNEDIQNVLGIQKTVNVNKVIEHLKTVVNVWEEKKKSNSQYNEMLQKIYQYLSKVPSQEIVSEAIQRNELVNWVWHGSGFCSPEQVALEKDLPFEFRPPLFLLLDTLNDGGTLTRFFKIHGVREQFSKDDIILVLAAIKEKHEEPQNKISPKSTKKDLNFCRSVLEWLVNDEQRLSEDLRAKVFVPVQSVEDKLVLKECEKCTYCDQEWLKHGKSELDIPDDFHPIHEYIPSKLAILLGVPSLSSCLLSAESIEFEQTGPYEPITTRIKNILKEYKEGVGIFKELIQNADDAGASTVKFLVDWRRGKTDSLFSPDMANSQGPALWAYNDAVFTDKDFENINKLAGGTKVEDLSKIGRFGLGFNAVYHLTDVPSFISRNYLCMFDPNVNHISNHIRDKSRPGIRIDLAKNSRPLTAFADQFSLFDQVFGCKTALNTGEKFHYQGTLFRFSFRTEYEAMKSEICDTVYNPSKVKEIVYTLQQSASLLLLFTQNVNHVELHQLGSTGNPQDTTLVLSINKQILNSINTVSEPSYIKQCSEWWQKKLKKLPSDESPSRLEQVKIVKRENPSTITDTEASLTNSCIWLVAYCVGKYQSITFAAKEGIKDGLLPLAGAATLLQNNSANNMVDTEISAAHQIEGEAFCFLPLSISTGLPIHVNSSFAVRANRDGIWERTTAEENTESRWNDCLLQDAIPEAYFMLLSRLVDLSKSGSLPQFDQCFHDFWPRLVNCRTSWKTLVSSFYTKMVQRDLKLFCSNGEWMNVTDGFILDDELRKYQDDKVTKTLQSLGEYVFDLPSDVIITIKNSVDCSVGTVIEKQTLSLLSFFEDFLFPNLPSISAELRNPIVHHGLHYILQESREDWEQLKSLYKETECIPCSPDGEKLARPCDLINPNVKIVAALYSPEENRFPFGELSDIQQSALEKLGMVKALLSWKEVCGRAKSIEELAMKDKDAALQRSRFLIKYLRFNIGYMQEKHGRLSSHLLENIKFLPVRLTPPATYALPWKGAEFNTVEFHNPNNLFLPHDVNLIGSSCLIVDDTDQSGCGSLQGLENVLSFSKRPSCQQVLQQLEITRESDVDNNVKITVCKLVYRHLNDELTKNPDDKVIKKLQNMAWLYLDGNFVENKLIALNWKGYAVPFLYSVTDEYKREFAELLKIIGIKEVFAPTDFLQALDSLRESKKNFCMKRNDINLVNTLINELKNDYNAAAVQQRVGTIPLPDTKGLLFNSEDLTIPERFHVKSGRNERYKYIHSDINQNIALKLGAKSLRARTRVKHGNTTFMSFGQNEKLTDRIRNILKSYPCDVGILKELVQNADDAKATEVQFIYDKRTLPHVRVLQDNAKKIQGPALCVYNNKHFSEDDFNGICKLGIGSKHDDPTKTGQYGIGFNAVYHLTDCPSFLSNDNDDITLCILDPHCEYSPEATEEAPGGRYDNIDDEFQDIFSDTLSGYLGNFGDHFPLQGSTIFRLPLRTVEQSKTSKISSCPFSDGNMVELVSEFQNEAKKLLLFLNHVKKIVLWEIDENCGLKKLYSVSSLLEQTNEKKLPELHSHLQLYKKVATSDVPIEDTTYTIRILDTDELEEEWLIHQRFGIKTETGTDEKTPNGCGLGLFPRGAIAALLSSNHVCSEEYVAYCFLPLPVKTSLPVNVNGHFALDGSRRNLWDDSSETCPKTIWNTFMKKQVLGPAFASLITRAREYIPNCENDLGKIYFLSEEDTTKALEWYHNLFPNPDADPKWKILALAVYHCLKETPVLPVVSLVRGTVVPEKDKQGECKPSKSPCSIFPRKCEKTPVLGKYSNYQPKYQETARGSNYEHVKAARYATLAGKRVDAPTKYFIEWLPPNIVYFTQEKERETRQLLLAALLQIHMPVLLYTPMKIYTAMSHSHVESHLLTPENVIKFLLTSQDENSRCNVGKLPIQLNSSNIQNKSNLRSILEYCKEALKKSPDNIHSLPLLLTDDNVLRAFSSETPVYCSSFSDLFPGKAFKFVQRDIVQLLSTFCVLQPDIVRNLTIQSLATEFMPDVFIGKLNLGENVHVPWCYPEKGVLSKKWFRRLWEFLQSTQKLSVVNNSTDESSSLLYFLGKYPIIPTTNGNLATVDNAKTVLAVTNNKKGNLLEQKVSEILKGLACPFLDTSITKDDLPVILRLVADPHRRYDVLRVLHYMNSTGILDMKKFDDEKINILLIYFQEDWQNQESMNIAKYLPFYKGVDGNYHSLSSYSSYIQVPVDLPDDGIKELQSIYAERVLFLPSQTRASHIFGFNRLYIALGIMVDCSFSKFYITYVLPNFSSFSRKCQIEFLTNIKSASNYMCDELKRQLQSTSCIPDQTGKLRVPSYYFNPHNELFKVMFGSGDNVFPTAPFNESDWVGFLVNVGMKKDCDEQQFIEFARGVEESARTMSTYDMNIIPRSKALVKYLLKSGRNWSNTFISQIEFIVPEEVENELSCIHPQYRVKEFVSFRNSVPWKHRHLAWTCVKLLPDWAYPDNIYLVSSLAIPSKPSLESVIKHVKIISKCATERIMSDSILPEKLTEVFKNVYAFLTEIMQNCAKTPPSPNCNERCRNIGKSLANVACILLSKERRLVKGDELSFEDTGEKLKPYFHIVPRDYSQYEHLLKRLGVTEKITASQMANVLKSIKDSCAEITMNSEDEQKVCFATSVLLKSLHGSSTDVESRLSNCEELSLPSMKKRLSKSKELVCKMQPRLRESVEKQGFEILYPLEKCGLKRELEDAYINAIPKRLRPTPLSSLVCEELDPSCKRDMACIYCTKMDCPFIQKFILLLRSSQFEHGILRLLKHQKEKSTLDDEDRAKAARFTSTELTVIKCMRQVQIHLVNAESKKSLPNSASVKTCQVEKQANSWTLYVQHEFGGRKHHAILAKAVNEIMDGCLKEIGELSDILSCDSPSEIPDVLNAHNVAPDYNEESEQLGQLVPDVYHYLMIQNPLCYFKEGTRVAYCNEGGEKNWKPGDQEHKSTTYTLAKILVRANAIDKVAGEFDFNAEYKIDFGRKADIKKVSVLDIYSYHQDDMGNPVSNDNVETQVDVVAEKSNITRALYLVKKLESLSRRYKVLRRLFLHWLRCKNAEVAAEMTTFIEDEVTRMEILRLEEARSYTRNWRSRGRRERSTFSGYNHWRSIGDHYTASEFVIPNKDEAERWIKQSKADLNVATNMLSGKSYSQVCFMSQQCVEKVLKGVLYAKCGIPRRELRTHEISGLVASASGLKGAPNELDRARKVADYYLPTRYPDSQPFPKVPVDEYSEKEAEEALNVAETVYTALEKFVHHNDD